VQIHRADAVREKSDTPGKAGGLMSRKAPRSKGFTAEMALFPFALSGNRNRTLAFQKTNNRCD